MRRKGQVGILLLLTLAVAFIPLGPFPGSASAQSDGEGILIGRISHVEGELLRYVASDKDWVATIKDTPFGFNDTLYSGTDGKAEFIMPNNTWVRIGGSTQIQLISLKPDVTEVDVASGVARFYNRSSDAVIKATTPYGAVIAEAGTVFDLYVGDESIEVIGIKGSVYFLRDSDQARFDVTAGSGSIIANAQGVYAGQGTVDSAWDDWNGGRDSVWTKRLEVKGDSARYVNPALEDEAYELDQHGRWEEVTYEGRVQHVWRPTEVRAGWAPFTDGRWSVYHEDQTWVPAEPFGYVTHHYGNWIFVNGAWCWMPPPPRPVAVVSVGVVEPGLSWYPGRVGWIHSGDDVGWVPLAPQERYYSHHHWGPEAAVVASVGAVSVAIGSYHYLDHAVVVRQENLYRASNYNEVRVTNINKTVIINNYRSAPVINNTVIKNYNNNPQRFSYANVTVREKPHQEVLKRIEHNDTVAKDSAKVNARMIEATGKRAKPVAAPTAPAQVAAPKVVTNKLVKPEDVAKPRTQVQFKKEEVKAKVKPASQSAATKMTLPAPAAAKPGTQVKPGEPAKPVAPGKAVKPGETRSIPPSTTPGAVTPPRPGEPARPAIQGKELKPSEPGKPMPPSSTQGTVAPARPGQQPARPVPPGRELRPGEPARPAGPSGTIAPARPGEPAKPAVPGRELKPGEPARPAGPSGTIAPARPGQPARPGEPAKPAVPGRELKPGEPARPVAPSAPSGAVSPSRPGRETRPAEPARPAAPGRESRPSGLTTPPAGRETRPSAPAAQPARPAGGREMRPAEPTAPRQPAASHPQMKEQTRPPAEAPHRGTPSSVAPREMRPSAPAAQPARPSGAREMRPAEQTAPRQPAASHPQMREQPRPSQAPAQAKPAAAPAGQHQTDKEKKKKPGQEP